MDATKHQPHHLQHQQQPQFDPLLISYATASIGGADDGLSADQTQINSQLGLQPGESNPGAVPTQDQNANVVTNTVGSAFAPIPRCDHCRRAGLQCTFNDAAAEARQQQQRVIPGTNILDLGDDGVGGGSDLGQHQPQQQAPPQLPSQTNPTAHSRSLPPASPSVAGSGPGPLPTAATSLHTTDPTVIAFAPPEKLLYPYTTPPQLTIDEINDWCGARGYAIVTQRSKKDRDDNFSKVYLRCDRGGRYECEIDETARQRGNYTIRRQECPWSAYLLKQGNQWLFVLRDPSHNHEPSTSIDSHPSLKKLAWDRHRGTKRPAGDGVVGNAKTDLEVDLTKKQREILERALQPRPKRPNGGRKSGMGEELGDDLALGSQTIERMAAGGGLTTVFRV